MAALGSPKKPSPGLDIVRAGPTLAMSCTEFRPKRSRFLKLLKPGTIAR